MSTPIVTEISPSSGPSSGGTQVQISGSGLSTATEPGDVQFGNAAAAIVAVTDTLLTVTSPPADAPGVVAISVETPNGAVIWENAFDYEVSVATVDPASGPVGGGTTVTITGSGLLSVHGVDFGAAVASAVSVLSDSMLIVTSPAAAMPGSVEIFLTGADGDAVDLKTDGFTYVAAPAAGAGQPGAGVSAGNGTSADGGTQSGTSPSQNQPGKQSGGNQQVGNQQGGNQQGGNQQGNQASQKQAGQPGDTSAAQPQHGTGGQSPKQPPTDGNAAKPAPAASGQPSPGDYIPGGAMTVPGGLTGLGTSAGTGAGFGVGPLLPGGGGSAAPSDLPYYADPGLTAQIVQSLIGLVQTAASPDAIEAQSMILRRMALEGDVVGSRLPPPRNVSEIGGYLNLLSDLHANTMREQALAGILGVAGPVQPLGWVTNDQPLSLVATPNDRPAVAAQPSFPLSTLVRSDFVAGLQAALKTLHGYGATLPLTGPSAITLPPGGTGATIPRPVLFYLGRMLTIAQSAALTNPATDPVALVTSGVAGGGYLVAARVLAPGAFPVPPADLQALQCTPTACTAVQLNQVEFVPVAPILAAAGFYSPVPLPVPAQSTQTGWNTLTNTTGLVAGTSTLGDELALLYRQDQVAASAFAAMLTWTWTGTAFAP